jgi:hypothetical protein
VHLDTIEVFYSQTDAQVNCLKNNYKIYIKINIKTAPTYFGAVSHTIIRERIILPCLASKNNSPKHVGAVLMLILM